MKTTILSEPIILNFGEKLEFAIEKKYKVFLPLNADWGYSFKIKIDRITFDLLIYEDGEINKNKIEISPDFNIFQRLAKPKYLSESQMVIVSVKDLVVKIQNDNI